MLGIAGRGGEVSATDLLIGRGELVFDTQFKQGAAMRGFDSLSVLRTPQGINVFVNEVKASSGNIVPSKFSALGLNRQSTFDTNLGRAIEAVQGQVTDPDLAVSIEDALLDRTFSIRIIGRPGIRITSRTEALIEKATGTNQRVIVLDVLAP